MSWIQVGEGRFAAIDSELGLSELKFVGMLGGMVKAL